MTRSKLALSVALALLLSGAAAGPSVSGGGEGGRWAERVQIVYDAATRSVERKRVKVWNAEPEKNLEFVWEPEKHAGTIAADGSVSGKGKLVWRVRGSASYDPKAVYSVYSGEMRDGRPHGKGRLELRSGEIFDGEWVGGRFEGQGWHLDADGNRHEGRFVAGVLHGQGRLLSATGEIFSGSFVHGKKHGKGSMRLAGGTTYESDWKMGIEIGNDRPDALADALVGGLLKVQGSGGDAGKVEITTLVDQRMNEEAAAQYQFLTRDDDIAIYPRDEAMNEAWNGTGLISTGDWVYTGIDWTVAPVFVTVDVSTTDGSKVRLQDLELQVASSEAYRKPMLSLQEHRGCVGFRPELTMLNHGWGGVKDAKLSIKFVGDDTENGPFSRVFTHAVPDFEKGTDVYLTDVLKQAGVDTAALETKRFSCPSWEGLALCRSQVFNSVNFGEVAEFVGGEDKLYTTLVGTFDYSWSDDFGNSYQQSEPIQFSLALATIEVTAPAAECGDGFGGSPEALRYQDVQLPINQRDYTVDIDVRGNRNITSYTARLKISSEMTSFHSFQPVAKFADGSERRGKPVSLFYFRPRPSDYQSQVTLPACYLDPLGEGCG
jgi:hypothetical protein